MHEKYLECRRVSLLDESLGAVLSLDDIQVLGQAFKLDDFVFRH